MTSRRRVAVALVAIVAAAATRAFAQTEQTREGWQRVADLFAAAGVKPGAHVADVGAGDGFLTVRLASAVGPSGRIYAVDIDEKVVDGLRKRLATAKIANVDVVVGAEDDPHLAPGTLDAAFIVNAYHEMPRGVAVLTHLMAALKPRGRLVLCEPVPRTPNQSRSAQMNDHVLDPALILEDLQAAGFHVTGRQDMFATNLGGTHFGFVAAERP
jgi:predicted methyltransferase